MVKLKRRETIAVGMATHLSPSQERANIIFLLYSGIELGLTYRPSHEVGRGIA